MKITIEAESKEEQESFESAGAESGCGWTFPMVHRVVVLGQSVAGDVHFVRGPYAGLMGDVERFRAAEQSRQLQIAADRIVESINGKSHG